MNPPRRDPNDLEAELQSHLALEEEALREAGVPPAEARRRARVAFGQAVSARERLHDTSRVVWLSTLAQDLRYGVRLLLRRPTFSFAAALVLALGIGATTALFSIVNGIFHRPLGVAEPERLFYFYSRNWGGQVMPALEPRTHEFFVSELSSLADFTGHWVWRGVRLKVNDEPYAVGAGVVESNFFSTAGVPMTLGRPFRAEDDDPANTEASMVISHELWFTRFDAAADVVGRQVELVDPSVRSRRYRIIGVAAPGFRGLTDALTPISCWVTSAQTFDWVNGRSGVGNYGHGPVGRLKPGATLEQVRALIAARTPIIRAELFDRLGADFRVKNPDWTTRETYQVHGVLDVQVPRDPTAWLIDPAALLAMGAVVTMVLVIATTNIAGLLVARGIGRSSEIAVRRALGAGGVRLARQVLTETTLLALVGGVAGGGLAAAGVGLFRAVAPSRLVVDAGLDWRVLVFATSLSVATGLLIGVLPAIQAVRVSVLESLGAGVVGSRRSGRAVGRWVLVPQTALALVLLLVAAVHVKAIAIVELANPGFRAEGAQTIGVLRTEPRPELGRTERFSDAASAKDVAERLRRAQVEWWARTWRFNDALVIKLEAIPGIHAAGVTSALPIGGNRGAVTVASHDSGLRPEDGKVAVFVQIVSNGYFNAVGTRLLAGRQFGPGDVSNSRPIAIVSEALARSLWPEGSPIGRLIAEPAAAGSAIVWREVVGVVAEIDPIFKPKGMEPRLYVPLSQATPLVAPIVIVRAPGQETQIRPDVRAAVLGTDGTAEITWVRTMRQVLDEYLETRKLAATVLVVAGLTGLVLAAVGLYGVVSYSAAERLRELGIRAALGASPKDLIAILLKEAAVVSAAGTVCGLVAAYLALRFTARLYPDLPVLDGVTFVLVPAVLLIVVFSACLIPATRGARDAPSFALRAE